MEKRWQEMTKALLRRSSPEMRATIAEQHDEEEGRGQLTDGMTGVHRGGQMQHRPGAGPHSVRLVRFCAGRSRSGCADRLVGSNPSACGGAG